MTAPFTVELCKSENPLFGAVEFVSGKTSYVPISNIRIQPGKPYGRCFLTEPVFGSFFPYGHFLLAGGRIWPYATRMFTNC